MVRVQQQQFSETGKSVLSGISFRPTLDNLVLIEAKLVLLCTVVVNCLIGTIVTRVSCTLEIIFV